jgi:thiol-disulfide isomerase/thioredoxin
MKHFTNSLAIFCIVIACQLTAKSQSSGVMLNKDLGGQLIGKTAPNFTFTKLLQTLPNKPDSISALNGNIIILEFWATWCAPCRVALKHLNVLAEKFTDKPIRFLAISREKQEVIENFLKSHPSKLWIGTDSNSEAYTKYKVVAIPHIVVIDKSGKVIAITREDGITEERLQALIEDKPVYFEPIPTAEEFIKMEANSLGAKILPYAVLKTCIAKNIILKSKNTGNNFTTVTNLISLCYEAYSLLGSFQFEISEKENNQDYIYQQKYFADIRLPQNDKQAIRDTLKTMIERDLLDIQTKMQKKNVWVLQRKNGTTPPSLSDALNPELLWERTNFKAVRQPVFSLAKYLNTMYNVIDETGLTGEYDLSFTWDITKKNSLEDGLASLGLEMVKAVREIKVYVIKLKANLLN